MMLVMTSGDEVQTALLMSDPPSTDLPSSLVSGGEYTLNLIPPSGLTIVSGSYVVLTDQNFDVTLGGFPLSAPFNLIDVADYTVRITVQYDDGSHFTLDKSIAVSPDYSDPANAQQDAVPVEQRQYPIVDTLGPFGDDTQSFEEQSLVRKVAYSAQRTHNEINYYSEQNADWGIIKAEATDQFVRTSADYNQRWIAYMAQGPGAAEYGTPAINTSWGFYNNWLLGVIDGASLTPYGGWSGHESTFKSYAEWYVNVKKTSVYAVPHNVVP